MAYLEKLRFKVILHWFSFSHEKLIHPHSTFTIPLLLTFIHHPTHLHPPSHPPSSIRTDKLCACGVLIQKRVRGFLAKVKYLKVRQMALKVQKYARGVLARRFVCFVTSCFYQSFTEISQATVQITLKLNTAKPLSQAGAATEGKQSSHKDPGCLERSRATQEVPKGAQERHCAAGGWCGIVMLWVWKKIFGFFVCLNAIRINYMRTPKHIDLQQKSASEGQIREPDVGAQNDPSSEGGQGLGGSSEIPESDQGHR